MKKMLTMTVLLAILLTAGCTNNEKASVPVESEATVSSTTEATTDTTTAITTTGEIVVESNPIDEPTEEPAERTETAEPVEQGTIEAEAPAEPVDEPAETVKPVETVAQTTKPVETTAQTTTATTKQTVSTTKVTTTTAKKPDPEPVIDIDLDAIKPNYVKTYPWQMSDNCKGAYQPKYWDDYGHPTFEGTTGFDVTYLVGQDIPEGWYFSYPCTRADGHLFSNTNSDTFVYRLNGDVEIYSWESMWTIIDGVETDVTSYTPFYVSKGDRVHIVSTCLIPAESAGYCNLLNDKDEDSYNIVGREGCPIKAGVKYKIVPSKYRDNDFITVRLLGRDYNWTWWKGNPYPQYVVFDPNTDQLSEYSCETTDPTVTLGDWVMQFKDGDIVNVNGAKLIPVDEATPEQMAFGVTTWEGEW